LQRQSLCCALGLAVIALCTLIPTVTNAAAHQQNDPNSTPATDSAQALQNAGMPKAPSEPNVQTQSQAKPLVKTTYAPAKGYSTKLGRELWEARITSGKDPNNSKKTELQRMIATIRSIKLKQSEPEVKTSAFAEPIIETKPNIGPVNPPKQKETVPVPDKLTLHSPSDALSPETLGLLKTQMQKPQEVNEPFELAEVLYRSGYLSEAAIAYEQALSQMDPKDAKIAKSRAWTLLQIGNCVRKSNPQEAIRKYRQVVDEHPDSPWTDLARTMNNLTTWYDQDKPHTVIADKQEPQSNSPN